MIRIVCAGMIFLFQLPGWAQIDEEINVVGLRLLDYRSELPDDILQKRAAVFISAPQKSAQSSERGDWKSMSFQAHDYFKQIGIDAAVYIYLDDALAGPDASQMYAKYLTEREIKYIIILSKVLVKSGNKIDTTHVAVITQFNGQPDFISNGQKAWKDQNKDVDRIMRNIYRIAVRLEFKRTNFLIIDQPEFIGGISIIPARRNESFPTDLRVDKIAVPKYVDYEIPSGYPHSPINNRISGEIDESNKINSRLNARLESIFSAYPWKYELVDYGAGEEQLFKDGFQYVLLRLNTAGNSIRQMLGYELNEGETDYITVLKRPDGAITFRSIPVSAPVYKYYIKHLVRKEIYIGEVWDADETWDSALEHFIANLKERLNK
jgi:hypothetical protein